MCHETDRLLQYALLSRLLKDQLKREDLPVIQATIDEISAAGAKGLELMRRKAERGLRDQVSERALQVEYAHLFLLPEGVKPYESVYLGSEKLLHQQPWVAVKQFYQQHGFVLEEGEHHPEDHASVELAFMAGLIELEGTEEVQQTFFSQHLLPWFPAFLDDLEQNPHGLFYREVARYAKIFISQEEQRFEHCMYHSEGGY